MNVLFAVPVVGFVVILAVMLNDQFRSRNAVPMQEQIEAAQLEMAYERMRATSREFVLAMYNMRESAKQAADRMERTGVQVNN